MACDAAFSKAHECMLSSKLFKTVTKEIVRFQKTGNDKVLRVNYIHQKVFKVI